MDKRGRVRRTAIRPLPFRVGRQIDSDLFLNSSHGSQRHAELFESDGKLWLRDLESTNGTSVNGERVHTPTALNHGDVLHFADCEMRAIEQTFEPAMQTTQVFSLDERERLEVQVRAPGAFREMLRGRNLRADFQPVVRLADQQIAGYELLGRAQLAGMDAAPEQLFYIAERLGDEVELSQAFREVGLGLSTRIPGAEQARPPLLFLNTHPAELAEPNELIKSIQTLRQQHPAAELVLEIHEAAVTNIAALRSLRNELEKLGIALAFDDFGTGQARLVELAEISPTYLKFDAIWIEDLHLASNKRREMIASLLHMVADLEIIAIAECVESREEAEACQTLGFSLAQGRFLGPPIPAAELGA
ncbi:MAG: EAL domain-containing protein [Acidobacteriota bacterium]